jgi:hypothetical protein
MSYVSWMDLRQPLSSISWKLANGHNELDQKYSAEALTRDPDRFRDVRRHAECLPRIFFVVNSADVLPPPSQYLAQQDG